MGAPQPHCPFAPPKPEPLRTVESPMIHNVGKFAFKGRAFRPWPVSGTLKFRYLGAPSLLATYFGSAAAMAWPASESIAVNGLFLNAFRPATMYWATISAPAG